MDELINEWMDKPMMIDESIDGWMIDEQINGWIDKPMMDE